MVGFNENSTKYYSNSIYSVVKLPATTSTGSTNYLPSSDSSASGGSVYFLVPTTSYSYQYIYSVGLTYDTDVSFRFPRALNNDGYDGGDIQNTAHGTIYFNGTNYYDYGTKNVSRNNATSVYNFLNLGTILHVSYTSAAATNPIQIRGVFDSRGFIGYVGDFIVFNTLHTSTDRILAEGILAWKWGVQSSLPNSHLYYNTAPSQTLI